MDKKQEGVPDFVLLETISEPAFIKNLLSRFKADQIYTYIGDVVISVNPFKQLNIYKQTDVNAYKGRYKYEMPPHIYALSNDAYRSMLANKENQCVIISGESGAGKTEASKIIMQYITSVSSNKDPSEDVVRIKTQLLESNPLLEAFGNATTLRNDNSSRFGKYMEMQFNHGGIPIGGKITNYLLEKSRVVQRTEGERSFHIFYQMLAGLSEQKLQEYKMIRDPSGYKYLKSSKIFTVSTINDLEDYKHVIRAMGLLGINEKDQQSIFRILAAILHLGNVEFEEDVPSKSGPSSKAPAKTARPSSPPDINSSTGINAVKVKDERIVQCFCELLGCDLKTVLRALTHRSISTGTNRRMSTISVPLDGEQAVFSRDALAKALYERLFHWLVAKINLNLQSPHPERNLVIGILDIYGFEVFDRNSFEQLTINYCNEKLQQLFIELTLKSEQEEYIREGIEWKEIQYFNNKPICELIEKKPIGIISLMDEACLMAKSTDMTLLEGLNKAFGSGKQASPHFESYLTRNDRTIGDSHFRLKHYAGDVSYDVLGFLEKNKDTLFNDLVSAMQTSSDPLLQEMFPAVKAADAKKRPETAGTQFRTALNSLIANLLACNPHYIRCIKPNDHKKAGVVDDSRVVHQVRYLGLLENVRVRRAGFANRQTYERFLQRYKMICMESWPVWKGSPRSGVEKILASCGVPQEEFRLGKTKVFIRNPTTLFMLEEKREVALPSIVTLIQKVFRGFRMRKRYNQRKAAIKIQQTYRKYKFRRWFFDMQKTFKNIKSDPSFGKNTAWPVNPPILQKGVEMLHKVHGVWRLEQMIARIGQENEGELRLKVTAYDIFKGHKAFNLSRRFEADYLEKPSNPNRDKYAHEIQKLFLKYGDTEILFADYVIKVNRKGKSEKRGVVVTNENLYKHDPKSYKLRKVGTPLVEIVSLSLSPFRDTFLVVHTRESGRDAVLDLGINGYEAYSEFVAVVYSQIKKLTGNKIKVDFLDEITYNNARPKIIKYVINFQEDSTQQRCVFKKVKGDNNVVLYP